MIKRESLQKRLAMAGLLMLLLAASCLAQISMEMGGQEICANYSANASSLPGLEDAVQEMNSSNAYVNQDLGPAKLVSPSGILNTGKPTYVWESVDGCLYYCLEVRNNLGNVVFKQWFNASDYSPAPGLCSVTPPAVLDPGTYKWKIMSWNCTDYQWSLEKEFIVCTSSSFPGKATLVSPNGIIGTKNPTFVWNAVTGCTRYCLKVVNVTNQNVPILEECYDVEEVLSEKGCSITPGLVLGPGSFRWWIKTINCKGDGPWSNFMSFRYLDMPPGRSTPISPRGLICTNTPAFIWTAVSAATQYHLQVENSTTIIAEEWYVAEDVTRGNRCSAFLSTALPDDDVTYFWRIQASNDAGDGPWSSYRYFEIVNLNNRDAAKKKARMHR